MDRMVVPLGDPQKSGYNDSRKFPFLVKNRRAARTLMDGYIMTILKRTPFLSNLTTLIVGFQPYRSLANDE